MFKKLSKYFSLILVLGLVFVSPGISLASPLTLYLPTQGEGDVPVDGYFQWEEAIISSIGCVIKENCAGPEGGGIKKCFSEPSCQNLTDCFCNIVAPKYVLDIDQFTQSEDNIPLSVCSGGTCFFAFLDLTVGNINYLSAYTWRVTAYDAAGNPIGSSIEDYTFTTERVPEAPSPPPGGEPNGGVPGGGFIPGLTNPLTADTLEEALNSLINFFFALAMILVPLMIVFAAFLMLTSAGDPTKVNKAKQIILWTVVALAIVLFAKGLPAVIKAALGG